MSPFHKIVLSCFGWQPLGVSHTKWFHSFLIPQNFQNGVTVDTAFHLTATWLNEYVSTMDLTMKVTPGIRYVNQIIQHADAGLIPKTYTEVEHDTMRDFAIKIMADYVLSKMISEQRSVTSQIFTDTLVDMATPDNLSIRYGDITSVERGMIVQGVNCQGAMGSGVALALLRKHPKVYDQYMETFREIRPSIGYTDEVKVSEHLTVANCYTQEFFGGDGKRYADLDAVSDCLSHTFKLCNERDIPIHLPRIASDLGGLSWTYEVYPIVVDLCKQYPTVPTTVWILTRDALKI